jgi:hypothetical protein
VVLLSIRIGNKKGVVSNGIGHSHDLNRVGNVIHNVTVGKEDHRIWKVPKQPQPIQPAAVHFETFKSCTPAVIWLSRSKDFSHDVDDASEPARLFPL